MASIVDEKTGATRMAVVEWKNGSTRTLINTTVVPVTSEPTGWEGILYD